MSNQISDISPLANHINLTRLGLCGNQISRIMPLANLTHLYWLNIAYNQIGDISSLVRNEGLGAGDRVDLQGNASSSDSINIYIPQLQVKGVTVSY